LPNKLSSNTTTSGSVDISFTNTKSRTDSNLVTFCVKDANSHEYSELDKFIVDLKEEFSFDDDAFVGARNEISATFYPEGNSLAALRLKAGLSQRGLADIIGTTQSYIARLEKGENNPGRLIMNQLCKALHIDMNTLNEALS
jgi:DNA-binding XRE family transcriptional regulator